MPCSIKQATKYRGDCHLIELKESEVNYFAVQEKHGLIRSDSLRKISKLEIQLFCRLLDIRSQTRL